MQYLCCFIFLSLFLNCRSLIPKIVLLEPINATIFALRKTTSRSPVAIRYNILNVSSSTIEICVQLQNADNAEKLLPSTCFPATDECETKALTDLPLGNFALSLVLQDICHPRQIFEDSRVDASFSVQKISDLLPKITLSSLTYFSGSEAAAAIIGLVNEMSIATLAIQFDTTDIIVEYLLSDSLLPMDGFDLCAVLMKRNSVEESIRAFQGCSSSNQRFVKLNGLLKGSYELTLVLAHTSDLEETALKIEREVYDSSAVTLQITVNNLTDAAIFPEMIVGEKTRLADASSFTMYNARKPLTSDLRPITVSKTAPPASISDAKNPATLSKHSSAPSSSDDRRGPRTEANKTYVLQQFHFSEEIEKDSKYNITTRKRVLGSSILGLIVSIAGGLLIRSSYSELLSLFIHIFRHITVSISNHSSAAVFPMRILEFLRTILVLLSRMVLRIFSLLLLDINSSVPDADAASSEERAESGGHIGKIPARAVDFISSLFDSLYPFSSPFFATLTHHIGGAVSTVQDCGAQLRLAIHGANIAVGIDSFYSSYSPLQLFCFFILVHTLLLIVSSLFVFMKRKETSL